MSPSCCYPHSGRWAFLSSQIMKKDKEFLGSKEARKELKISDCDLAHIRQEGKLRFVKKGNAFMYLKEDVIKNKSKK